MDKRDACIFPPEIALERNTLAIEGNTHGIDHAPGNAAVPLTTDDIQNFVLNELHTPILNELYPHLWSVGRRSSEHIDALHVQLVKGRNVVINENANMHLVWSPQMIFIKPIPLVLLNHTIWEHFLALPVLPVTTTPVSKTLDPITAKALKPRKTALGFLHSYAFLIKHPSDFKIAQEKGALSCEYTWLQWQKFIACFATLDDNKISLRYHYGQLRLSRLNWAVRIFQPRSRVSSLFYEIPYWSMSVYTRQILAPLIFLFASVTVVLSAMQVMLGASGDAQNSKVARLNTESARLASWIFCLISIILVVLMWVLILGIPLGFLVWQLRWGYRKKSRGPSSEVVSEDGRYSD